MIGGRGYFCREKNPFSYEVEGRNYFDIERHPFAADGDLVLFADGEEIAVSTEAEPVRFLLMSGKPIGEPVAWYGPIVMNTQEELRIAFEEYENGTFIKHGKGVTPKKIRLTRENGLLFEGQFLGRIGMETVRTSISLVRIAIIGGIIIPLHIGAG